MKIFLLLAIALSACLAPPVPSGCSKDTDCTNGRICQAGQCTSPGGMPGPVPTGTSSPDGGTFPTTGMSGCGETDISCNCQPTSAYPGDITATSLCQSGYHEFSVCGQCPNGGEAWLAQCYCQ